MKKIAIVFAIVGLLFGVACAAESEKEVTITAKPQVPEQTIKIELSVPDVKVVIPDINVNVPNVKVEIPPVKIEPATSQVDVGTVITQVEGYYDNAYTKIDQSMSRWVNIWGIIIGGVAIFVTIYGVIIPIVNEKQRKTDFTKIEDGYAETTKQLEQLEGRVEKQISDFENLKVRLEEGVSEEKPKTVSKKEGFPKPAIELKILNTLWKRQMFKYPELDGSWVFKINEGAPDFLEFRDASNRLIGEGLISETETDHFLRITTEGLRYCAENYEKFPPDMWFEDVTIPEDNRKRFFKKLKQDRIME